jgi:hypothetical protein
MKDFIRGHGRQGGALALLVSVFTIMTFAVAGPALADPTAAENFQPNNDNAFAIQPLSDRPDGSTSSNATAHVTTVATSDAAAVEWFICPTAYADGGDPTQPASGCTAKGLDTTSTTPTVPAGTGGPAAANIDEAYEAEIDLTADNLAGNERDLVSWNCTSATVRTQANCDDEVESTIIMDDASTGANPADQTSSGEITNIPHGGTVSETGFKMVVRTSPDVTELAMCWESGADANAALDVTPPGGCVNDTTPDNTDTSVFKQWSGFLDPLDDAELGLWIYDVTGGQGACAPAECVLDSHYAVSSNATPTKAVIDITNTTSTPPSACIDDLSTPAVTEGPDTSEADTPGPTEEIRGCVVDQSNNLFTGGVETAFQITPVDPAALAGDKTGFDSSGSAEGDENDLNADNFFEQVDADGGDLAGGEVRQSVEFHRVGTYTLTFCVDSDNNAEDTPPVTVPPTTQSATPCAGEALSASATKTIAVTPGSAAAHSHLLRSSDVAANSSCHVGPSAFSAPAGTNVNLTGCLKDTYENPVPGARTIWTAVVLGTAFFVGTPESLSDANGQADAVIGSPASAEGKNTTIQFCQDENADGACDGGSASTVNIAWGPASSGGPTPAACNKIKGTAQNNLLVGTSGCDKIFARGGDDTSRGKAGNDKLNGGRGFDKARGGPGTDTCPRSEDKKSC